MPRAPFFASVMGTSATVSALSVVNFQFARRLRHLPVGAPAIAAWIGRHGRQAHAAGAA
jgi:hypothetical protein